MLEEVGMSQLDRLNSRSKLRTARIDDLLRGVVVRVIPTRATRSAKATIARQEEKSGRSP
jgi:hypothetical protein